MVAAKKKNSGATVGKLKAKRASQSQVRGVEAESQTAAAGDDALRALHESQERILAILNTAVDAIITIDQRGIVLSVNPATERMFGYSAAEIVGQNIKMLMPPPYRDEHDGYLARYQQTREKHIIGIGREVEARRKDGRVFSVDLAVSEVDHLNIFTGILRDITRRKELERDVVEIASQEQRRIGQDLHDSVAQELTALNLLVGDLIETLRSAPASSLKLAKQIAQGLRRSEQELRAVLRGLLPVSIDSQGLMAALSDLAERIQRQGKLTCSFDCPTSVSVADNLAATHLYLIAQEAVHNAVKHARARNIRIALNNAGPTLMLSVEDDGTGMPAGPAELRGLGLRIMRNRAAILGARLTVKAAMPAGTVVTCSLARKNNEAKT